MYAPEEDGFLNERRREAVLFGDETENGKLQMECVPKLEIFRQGEPAESVFYLRQGAVKLSVTAQ